MLSIINDFLLEIVNKGMEYFSEFFVTKFLVQICLRMEEYIGANLSGAMLDTSAANSVMSTVTKFAVALITLKFLKKGFDHYVTFSGEPDHSPLDLLFAYVKAMAVALCFPSVYDWIAEVVESMISEVLSAAKFGTSLGSEGIFTAGLLTTGGIITVIFAIVYLISFVQLYLQFLMRGMEIFIVRMGVPLACVGMIDSNGGVWTGYLAKLFQAVTTVIVQAFLFKFSMLLFLAGHLIWAIAAIRLAIKTPRLLAELIVPAQQGGGKLMSVYYSLNMGRQALSMLKR